MSEIFLSRATQRDNFSDANCEIGCHVRPMLPSGAWRGSLQGWAPPSPQPRIQSDDYSPSKSNPRSPRSPITSKQDDEINSLAAQLHEAQGMLRAADAANARLAAENRRLNDLLAVQEARASRAEDECRRLSSGNKALSESSPWHNRSPVGFRTYDDIDGAAATSPTAIAAAEAAQRAADAAAADRAAAERAAERAAAAEKAAAAAVQQASPPAAKERKAKAKAAEPSAAGPSAAKVDEKKTAAATTETDERAARQQRLAARKAEEERMAAVQKAAADLAKAREKESEEAATASPSTSGPSVDARNRWGRAAAQVVDGFGMREERAKVDPAVLAAKAFAEAPEVANRRRGAR